MKPALPTLFWLSLTAAAFAADGTPATPVAPQPRIRLLQTPTTAVRLDAPSAPPVANSAVVMDKFVVRDSILPRDAQQRVEPDPGKFTLLDGGRFFTTKLGTLPVEVGMWTPREIMPETAKFRPQKTHAEFDFLRLKF